ncbi:MAG: hypothetical protein WC341_09205 [Bacteroidales bacterium]|jgi:hypothetical protein
MDNKNQLDELFQTMVEKATLKQHVYNNTLDAFKLIKASMLDMEKKYTAYLLKKGVPEEIPFEANSMSDFEIELRFGGDVLLFMMHTNIFEFSRHHEVMHTDYIYEDKTRSYCGVINIYNFLSDSFKYNRVNDIGYLIGRVFVNKDNHYFIDGKRELGYIFNNFGTNKVDDSSVINLLEAAISYTVNFDLLTPDYELVKEVSVYEMKNTRDIISLKTGKRLGFKFQADHMNDKE